MSLPNSSILLSTLALGIAGQLLLMCHDQFGLFTAKDPAQRCRAGSFVVKCQLALSVFCANHFERELQLTKSFLIASITSGG